MKSRLINTLENGSKANGFNRAMTELMEKDKKTSNKNNAGSGND